MYTFFARRRRLWWICLVTCLVAGHVPHTEYTNRIGRRWTHCRRCYRWLDRSK